MPHPRPSTRTPSKPKRDLAGYYVEQARYEDSERLLKETLKGRKTKLGPDHPHTIESVKQLATLYESWPKPEEAEKWRANLPETKAVEE